MMPSSRPLRGWLVWSVLSVALGAAGVAAGQEAAPPSAPSSSAASSASSPSGGTPKPAPQSTAQIEAGEPRAGTTPAADPGTTSVAPSPRPPPRAAGGGRAPAAPGQKATADRLDLGVATVTGDREQPKVMYVVPWKKSDIGDLSGKPMNSLLDEALAPVDRDEFKREVVYYDAVKSDASHHGSNAPAQGEK